MSFLGDIGRVVAGGAAGIPFGLPGVITGAVIGGSDAGKDIARVTTKFVAGVGDVVVSGGTVILDAVGDAGKAFVELVGDLAGAIALRPLRPSELKIAKRVYPNSTCMPLDRIVICSLNGWGQRPFCMPGGMVSTLGWAIPGIGPLLAVSSILGNLTDKYILFLGRDGYRNANWIRSAGDIEGQTLIHEIGHAWQGHHTRFAWSYIFGSLAAQAQKGEDAYKYTPGAQFRTYNPEQQAHIIEDWFVESKGGTTWGPKLRDYMTSNVWPGKPDAETVFSPPSPGSLLDAAKAMETQGRAMIAMSARLPYPYSMIQRQQGEALVLQAQALRGTAKQTINKWSIPIIPGAVGAF